MALKSIDMKMLRSWGPCYDPSKYFAEDWTGTSVDILKDDRIPYADRLWVVLRIDLCSEKLMRLFAVWAARQVQHLMKDHRSTSALDVAERFANGEATQEELYAAWAAARSAAESAARSARSAAWSAAGDAQKNKLIEMIEAEHGAD